MVSSTVMAGCARKVRMFGTGVQCADVGVTGGTVRIILSRSCIRNAKVPDQCQSEDRRKKGLFVIFKSLKRPKLFLGVCEPKYLFTM